MLSIKDNKKNILRYIDTASFIKKNGYVLDIGAKNINFSRYIKEYLSYHAIDIDKDAINKLQRDGIKCMLANAEKIPQKDNYYDTVIMGEVLEHIPNMGLVLREVYRVLKDDGEFILSVPNGELKTRIYLMLKRFYKIPYIKKCEKREITIGGHIHMFNVKHLSILMKTYNFIIDEYINNMKDEYIIMRCCKYVC